MCQSLGENVASAKVKVTKTRAQETKKGRQRLGLRG